MEKPVVIFDGDCGFCNFFVQFLLDIDKNDNLLFASSSSDFIKSSLNPDELLVLNNTVMLLHNNEKFYRSKAVIKILALVGFPSAFLMPLRIIPSSVLDIFYRLIARYRKYFFRTQCRLPDAKTSEKFLR